MAHAMPGPDEIRRTKPYLMQLKIVLIMTLSHFKSPGLLDEQRMDHAAEAGKQIVSQSQKQVEVRVALGLAIEIWVGLREILSYAIPLLEKQSFPIDDPNAPGYAAIAGFVTGNYTSLLKDVERVNDLCTVGRNLLATKPEAQDLAAETKLDQNVLKLIDLCVRVTARGYDGEVPTRTEDKWQKVVNVYKKLLITCLQFLHNLVMNNERRKLLLWMDLFGSSPCADPSFMGRVDPAAYFHPEDYVPQEQLAEASLLAASSQTKPSNSKSQLPPSNRTASPERILTEAMGRVQLANSQAESSDHLPAEPKVVLPHKGKERANSLPGRPTSNETGKERVAIPSRDKARKVNESLTLNGRTIVSPILTASNFTGLCVNGRGAPEDDEVMLCTPTEAAQNLLYAKKQVVDRLRVRREPHSPAAVVVEGGVDHADDQDLFGEENDTGPQNSVVDDDENEAYHGPGDQERGLLTDVPLVLGPNEIEALPMIIQTGVVDGLASRNPEGIHENMQAIRCNILISQESGRALLRELLVFIAAWDLAEDEVYYKMMVQIMDSILINGLVPYTYSSFAEPKDIVSPAQAVVIKLHTQIFRSKLAKVLPTASESPSRLPFLRVHMLLVRFLFAQFRQNVIPDTCGLVYLQGQIRSGDINAKQFPLNLWDIERVYEGVYQYLELFAVLTEIEGWKRLLVKWEIAFELIALLRELDHAIPRGPLVTAAPAAPRTPGASSSSGQPRLGPISVERPFDRDPVSPTASVAASGGGPAPAGGDHAEEFEWRNLKKLIVLVLSSLVWKCPAVQNQVRRHGGVELILQCCNYDSHNPYIREHAIMCLRFLLEGNEENAKIVRDLEAKQVVPSEILDERGYETFIDAKGRVGLRRKDEGARSKAAR